MPNSNQPDIKDSNADDNMGYGAVETEVKTQAVDNKVGAQEQINQVIKEVTIGDDGKLQYPTDMDPMLKAAVAAEKKYRDTQSGYTKSQMTLKEIEAENQSLREQLDNTILKSLELSPEESERLDDLKYTSPEEWRAELNKVEELKAKEVKDKRVEVTEAARAQASKSFEVERRTKLLEEFNSNREVPLNDSVIENDIPPRITKKLQEGKVSFEDFLTEVDEYLAKSKVVSNPADPSLPDIHRATGGTTPTNMELEPEIDYSQLTL